MSTILIHNPFSYGKEYYSTLFNVAQEAKSALPHLGIGENANLCDILFLAVNPGANTDTLKLIGEGFGTRKFTDGETTGYFYEFYEPWYNDYVGKFGINRLSAGDTVESQNYYYNFNHFPGLVYTTQFLLEKVKQLQY